MTSLTSRETNLRNREAKVKSSFKPQGLSGIIKSLHHMITSDPVDVFSGYPTIRIREDLQREFELQKLRAIAHISRLKPRFL